MTQQKQSFVFISTMTGDPWGGSEELWVRTARRLAERGHHVVASVHGWPHLDSRISDLSNIGINVRPRYIDHSYTARLRRRISGKSQFAIDIDATVGRISPDLVLISEGGAYPPIEWLELCVARGWPFATIMHANADHFWPGDASAARYRAALAIAKRCFFVSKANHALEEKQLGYAIRNAEIVRNPVNISTKLSIPWPRLSSKEELLMACVGRLAPAQKGQDLLIEALAAPHWKRRNWRLALYGDGPQRNCLERLICRLELGDRILFKGHCAVEQIWRDNHILVMPSRFEGLPLTIVEAMLCGRPVIATDVGGNGEVIEDCSTGFLAKAPTVASITDTLERVWDHRDTLQEMGTLAAEYIRKLIPEDPVGDFAEKLLNLARQNVFDRNEFESQHS